MESKSAKAPRKSRKHPVQEKEVAPVVKVMRFAGWGFVVGTLPFFLAVIVGLVARAHYNAFPIHVDNYTANLFFFCIIGSAFSFSLASQFKKNPDDPAFVRTQFRNWLVAMFIVAVITIFSFAAYQWPS